MTHIFNPVEELRRHGLCGDNVPPATERILGTLTRDQVDFFVRVKERGDALQQGAPSRGSDDASIASAMKRAMGWDRPSTTRVNAEVEAMSATTVTECLCLCTGGGGGGGGSLD